MGSEYNDYPIDDILKSFERLIAQGATCYQKFTCAGCGNRLTIDIPNLIFLSGECDNCDTITDIEKQGCNFMYVAAIRRA